jgi:hypothetical protein
MEQDIRYVRSDIEKDMPDVEGTHRKFCNCYEF